MFATLLQIQNNICWNSKYFHEKTKFGQKSAHKWLTVFNYGQFLNSWKTPGVFNFWRFKLWCFTLWPF